MSTKRLAGNVRTILLGIIAEQGPIYGLEIAREYQARLDNATILNAGTLYPALHRLEQLGLVTSEEKAPPQGRIPVSYYTVTEMGRQAFVTELADAKSILGKALKVLEDFKPFRLFGLFR